VACGGVKRLDDATGEIKRMFVAPEARGRGVARALLAALEETARGLGYERVRLDTGAKQPHAQALYASAGYAAIPDYNRNAYASYWFEKEL
jgi:GNAT superfamily N-acetyltransferase